MIQKRIDHAQHLMNQKGHEALFTNDSKMLFYFTGMQFSAGAFILTKKASHLFLDGRYSNQAEPLRSRFSIHPIASMDTLGETLSSTLVIKGSVAFSPSKVSYALYLKLQSAFPVLTSDEALFTLLRRKKESEEIQLIQESCDITQKVMQNAFTLCKKGISEKELSNNIKKLFLEYGADIAFDPCVAFGKNSACPHWHPSDERLKDQELVLIDIGALWNNYASDMTRVLFLKPPQKEIKEAFLAVQQAYEAAASAAKPGVDCAYLDALARKALQEAKLEDFFTHGLGHGVGLEVHEAPRLNKFAVNTPLIEGDVITIEPGVYLPNIGGIRLENTLIIEKERARSFMSMPFFLEA